MVEKQETVRQRREQEEPQALPSVGRQKAEGISRAWGLGRTGAPRAETGGRQEQKSEEQLQRNCLRQNGYKRTWFLLSAPISPKSSHLPNPTRARPLPKNLGNAPAGGSPFPREGQETDLSHQDLEGIKSS